jgi:hypothetical protein
VTVVNTVLSATGVGQKTLCIYIYIYIYMFEKSKVNKRGFQLIFKTGSTFIIPNYLKMFQYSLNISNKICNYVVKPSINSLTTEGELIIIVTI